MYGWNQGQEEHLPPGYSLDTSRAASWVLRRPDGTAAGYFGAWGVSREAVEKAAREDHRKRSRNVRPLTRR